MLPSHYQTLRSSFPTRPRSLCFWQKAPYLSALGGLICADPSGRCCGAGLCLAEFVPDGGPRCSNKFKQNPKSARGSQGGQHTHHEATVATSATAAVPQDAAATAPQAGLSSPQPRGEGDFPRSNAVSQELKRSSLVPWSSRNSILTYAASPQKTKPF